MSDESPNPTDLEIYQRDQFTCVYCGFDGRSFDTWMQLSIDHVKPRRLGLDDSGENRVTACQSCNSATSRMEFPDGIEPGEIIEQKRRHVRDSRVGYHKHWLENVASQVNLRPWPYPSSGSND